MDDYTLLHGDCLAEMAAMDAGSVDAVVCDPPYGLEFMGKEWDKLQPLTGPGGRKVGQRKIRKNQDGRAANWNNESTGYGAPKKNPRCKTCGRLKFAGDKYKCHCDAPDWDTRQYEYAQQMQIWHQAWATEALRVLKPSHYLMAFGGTRTWHRLACAIEDAGFEIRDTLMWLYGSGFPKGKSCLKPAWEPIILARKPGPMRELGIEECRVGATRDVPGGRASTHKWSDGPSGGFVGGRDDAAAHDRNLGRWPANLILECTCDETREGTVSTNSQESIRNGIGVLKHGGENARPQHADTGGATIRRGYGLNGKESVRIHTDPNCPCAMLDGQTGTVKGAVSNGRRAVRGVYEDGIGTAAQLPSYADSGGASRFFYCSKASRSERNAGCEGMEASRSGAYGDFAGDGRGRQTEHEPRQNHHPTVKPLALMRWLVKLVAQPGDVVLDPFMGSGTTGVACAMEGREFVGIEQDAEYIEISRRRIEHASAQGRLPLDESPPLAPVAGRPT